MKKLHQEIVFQKKDRETKEEFFQRIAEQIRLLLEEEYLVVVRYDEPGLEIVLIEFEHDNHFVDYGCSQPVWITSEEEERLFSMDEDNEEVL